MKHVLANHNVENNVHQEYTLICNPKNVSLVDRDAALTAREPSPVLICGRGTSKLLLLAENSALADRYGRTSSHRYMGAFAY